MAFDLHQLTEFVHGIAFRTSREPAAYPQGGASTISTYGAPQLVASMRQPPGTTRKTAVVITSPGVTPVVPDPGEWRGIAARVTFGSSRGLVKVWTGVPAIVPVEGEVITVEAMLVSLPYKFGGTTTSQTVGATTTSVLGPGIVGPLPGLFPVPILGLPPISCSAYLIDAWADYPLDTTLFTGNGTAAFGSQVPGPVFCTAINIANRNAAANQVVIADGYTTTALGLVVPIMDKLLVPGASTIALNINKPFFRGISVQGLADWNAQGIANANNADLNVTVYGFYLPLA